MSNLLARPRWSGWARRLVVAAGLLAATPSSAGPPETEVPTPSAPEPGLRVLDAVRTTLARSPGIATAEQELESSRGALEVASGRFDVVIDAQAGQRGDRTPAIPSAAGSATTTGDGAGTTYTTDYGLGATQELRWGLKVQPHVSVSRLGGSLIDPPHAESHLGVTVTQPLWRGRGTAATAARETAARIDTDAAALRARQVVADRVLATVQAYWSCRAAWETVEILARAEQRAARFLDEERRMVEEHERAPTELHQVRAALADASASRADATRVYLDARHQLGLAMGLTWREIDALPPPIDPLDATRAAAAPLDAERLIGMALARRSDLRASRIAARASAVLVGAGEDELQPRLDISAELGYTGLASGHGPSVLITSLGHGVVGPNFFAGLVLQLPTPSLQARGALRQERARLATLDIASRDLERTIGANVALRLGELQALQRQLTSAEEAVDDFLAARDNEVRKLRSNLSTEFDVLQIESRLTAAQLSAMRARASVLQALAQLRFETGTLIDGKDSGALSSEGLLTIPVEPSR
ncbi:MAG TPA: TolC family protein [Kofleriaceae bacterium]|nr:TolC family protein [Kofleriaceae bacterium]